MIEKLIGFSIVVTLNVWHIIFIAAIAVMYLIMAFMLGTFRERDRNQNQNPWKEGFNG